MEQGEARRKEEVVDTLGSATTRLRARLGESMPSIQKYDVSLEQATTPSLDALKAYGEAFSTQGELGDLAAVPFFKRAIELDPNFALAYGALAANYRNLGESELARQNAIKAYELRDRVTEFERHSIEAWYHLYVTGDFEKAAEAFEIARRNYPVSSRSLNDLGVIYGSLGFFDKEIEIDRESLRSGLSAAAIYGNLAVSLMAVGKIDEAGTVLAEAGKRSLQSDYLLQVNYWRAFLRGDSGEMQRILLRSSEIPGAQAVLLSEQANTESYSGHFAKARQLSQTAAKLLQRDGQEEAASLCLAQAAVREAEAGDSLVARDLISRALHLSRNQNVLALAALVMVRSGDIVKGRSWAEQLDQRYPSSTFIQKYWLPVIGAVVELRQDRGAKAVSLLSAVEPLDSAAPDEFSISTLYPAYVRGQSYLAAGDGGKAAAEFQKLIDHPGMVLNFPLGAMARLGQARAYALSRDSVKARDAYRDFFQLWRDADPGLPILKRAKMEYTALR
jgi:tetratricopeptide (TPR) repeat protein